MTARDFTPTDEQRATIESVMADIVPKALDVHPGAIGLRRLREGLEDHPAFQSIIAAAKAEARTEIADEIEKRDWDFGERGDWAYGAFSAAERIVEYIRVQNEASA